MGCVPVSQVEIVLRGFVGLAAEALPRTINGVKQPGNARDYAAAMKVPIAVARLEIEREKLDHLHDLSTVPKTQVNLQVNLNNGELGPVAESARILGIVEILNAGRTRRGLAAIGPVAPEVCTPRTDGEANEIPAPQLQ
jgi:hypothetical protein